LELVNAYSETIPTLAKVTTFLSFLFLRFHSHNTLWNNTSTTLVLATPNVSWVSHRNRDSWQLCLLVVFVIAWI